MYSSFSQRGKDGNITITASSIVNEYTTLTNDASIGDVRISVLNSDLNENGRFGANLNSGDLIMLYQAQGAEMLGGINPDNGTGTPKSIDWGNITDYLSSGNYEIKEVSNVIDNGTIEIDCPLEKNYTVNGRTQIVRIPRYESLTVENGGVIECANWDGEKGGVLSIEVKGNLVLNGEINATGKGFRGGEIDAGDDVGDWGGGGFAYSNIAKGARKGESIVGYAEEYNPIGGMYGQGAPANGGGGGNSINAGGGGGANAGDLSLTYTGKGVPDLSNNYSLAWELEEVGLSGKVSPGGGKGGYTFSDDTDDPLTIGPDAVDNGTPAWAGDRRRAVGGYGGRPLDYSTGKLFLGGGGGAGDGDDNLGGKGGNGGAIVVLRVYNDLTGNGSITSNGENGSDSRNGGWGATDYDGAGGGGAGGTVKMIIKGNIDNTITINTIGGTGGNNNGPANALEDEEADGPGGGGGGGYIASNRSGYAFDVSGGANGISTSWTMDSFKPNGATAGSDGTQEDLPTPLFFNDTTLSVCKNDTVNLLPILDGIGDFSGLTFNWWNEVFSGELLESGTNQFTIEKIENSRIISYKSCPGLYRSQITINVDTSVKADAGLDTAVCSGLPVQLNGSGGNEYLWYPTVGMNDSSLANPIVSITGTQKYYLLVTGASGCTDLDSVIVSASPDLVIGISTDTTICYGDTIGIFATGGENYNWNNPGSLSNNNASNVLAFPVETTSYLVQVIDSIGCTGYDSVQVSVLPRLQLNGVTDTTVCENGCIAIEANVVNGSGNYEIDWSHSNDSTLDIMICPDNDANYELSIIDDQTTCAISENFQLNVANITASFTTDTICVEQEFQALDNSSGDYEIIDWSWDISGLYSADIQNPRFELRDTGWVTVELKVKDELGCEDSVSEQKYVNGIPEESILANILSGCAPLEVIISGEKKESDCIYNWELNGSAIGSNTEEIITLENEGKYDVSLEVISAYGCVQFIDSVEYITVYENPIADFSFSPSDTIKIGETVELVNESGDIVNSKWGVGEDGEFSEENGTLIYDEEGDYCVLLNVENEFGCKDSIEKCLRVYEEIILNTFNVITPNGDGANDFFEVEGLDRTIGKLEIYNRWGNLVYVSNNYHNNWNGIDDQGNQAPKGTYYYILELPENKEIIKGYFTLIK